MPTANRLAAEQSPYLLQHADNPVDWWPWCDEAFEQARVRDVPVFVSVGYSACHWCHVMAHESFEDPAIGDLLSEGFVAVKVDREERPDVDAVYMEAVQLVTGAGGWPMTLVVLPDGRPFWAGTYLPKQDLAYLLREISSMWSTDRPSITLEAERLSEAVRTGAQAWGGATPPPPAGLAGTTMAAPATPGPSASPGANPSHLGARAKDALGAAAQSIVSRHDPEWGGRAGSPKFPQPATLELLARHWWRARDAASLAVLCRSLDAMSSGGIYDHLGGGFARYSTDRKWLVPHFEKMLYDNALLVKAYTVGWQLTGSERYRQVVEETVGYMLQEPLRLSHGAWASSEDADSEGKEGFFYTWDLAEVEEVGGSGAGAWYGATPEGNWEGRNILWRPGIGELGRPAELEAARSRLWERRSTRPRPALDDKVVTEWNAMAIAALSYAGSAFGHHDWVSAAEGTAELLVGELRRSDGRWLRSWRSGVPSRHLATAADYAWLVEAFTRLGEATGGQRWTEEAALLADGLEALFWDAKGGGFFSAGHDSEQLVVRMKDVYDGAVPSANATAAGSLARLGALTGEARYTDLASATVAMLVPAIESLPSAFCGTVLAADLLCHPGRQVVVASGDRDFVKPVWSRYLPDAVLAWGPSGRGPLWEGRAGPDCAGLAFVCEGRTCRAPVGDPASLAALLDQTTVEKGCALGIHQ